MSRPQTWLILGASSPIARAFAAMAARHGHAILLAGRDRDDLANIATDLTIRHQARVAILPFDATDPPTHAALAESCREVDGTLNIFLAFGHMPEQTAMQRDPALARACIDATFTGAVSVLEHLVPILEERRQGRVAVLGSVAGDRGRLKNYIYGAAKGGLHTYLQGLRARLFRAEVSVTTLKPGFVDTGMTWGLPGLFLVASPEQAAAACWRHAMDGDECAYVPGFWWGIMTIIRAIPERIFKRLSL